MSVQRSLNLLIKLFNSKKVVDLSDIQKALGDASVPTVFRYLKQIDYRRSYNHNGRYYSLYNATQYSNFGLWTYKGIHFSTDGSLKNTVKRIVQESSCGVTHSEIQEKLRIRVQNTLLQLVKNGEIIREQLLNFYVYFHSDPLINKEQIKQRQEQIDVQQINNEITNEIVIKILLILIRFPGSKKADIVKHLRGNSPPIKLQHVQIVFDRYELDNIKKK